MKISLPVVILTTLTSILLGLYLGNAIGVNAQTKRSAIGECIMLKNIYETLPSTAENVKTTKTFIIENMHQWDSIQEMTDYKELLDVRVFLGSFQLPNHLKFVQNQNRTFMKVVSLASNTAEQGAAAKP